MAKGPLAVHWGEWTLDDPHAGTVGRARVELSNAGTVTWRDGSRERRSGPVPDDRVAVPVEPVVRELQAVRAARAPRRCPAVLEHDVRNSRRAGALRRHGPLPEERCERVHGGRV